MSKRQVATFSILRSGAAGAALLALVAGAPGTAQAQGRVIRDEPTAYQEPTHKTPVKEAHGVKRFLEAVCWYIPNRIVDLTDIPRVYITAGDGMGASVRATKYLNATWFQDDANGLGWTMRKPPFFGEQLNERYFGFLAAEQGRLERDPSEIGLSFHFISIGANFSASLSEAADFVLGFVGVDLRGDDHGPVLFEDYTKRPNEPKTESEPTTHAVQITPKPPTPQPMP